MPILEPPPDQVLNRNQRLNEYCNLMRELKARLGHLEATGGTLLDAIELPITLQTLLAVEGIALQMRKILELLAYSALLANEETAARLKPKFADMRRAKRVLEVLSEINPEFFPVPLAVDPGPPGELHLSTAPPGEAFTKDEFAPLFDASSEILHVRNPFAANLPIGLMQPRKMIRRVRALLNFHEVTLSASERFAVEMGDWSQDEVRALHLIAPLGG